MAAEPWTFRGVLIGREPPAEHIARIAKDPLFRTRARGNDPMHLEVAGPLKEALTCTFEEVLAKCQERAKELGVEETGVAESTASKIVYADIAERQVLAGQLTIMMSGSAGTTRGDLELTIDDCGPKYSRACIPDYVRWRIGCVAQALRMEIGDASNSHSD